MNQTFTKRMSDGKGEKHVMQAWNTGLPEMTWPNEDRIGLRRNVRIKDED